MREARISDELFSRFLDGSASAAEDEQMVKLLAENPELLDEMTAIGESSKLEDQNPFAQPELETAARNIHATLTATPADNADASTVSAIEASAGSVAGVPAQRKRRIRLFAMAAAAVATILLASTIYLLLRPSDSQDNFAQESGAATDSMMTKPEVEQTYVAQNEDSGASTQQEKPLIAEAAAPSATENATPTSGDVYHSAGVEERHYAVTQEANSLTVIKPGKDHYRVLCKNLEKSLQFEWIASNVRQLRFTVQDASGKTVAEVSDPKTKHYELTYRNVFPEKRLSWKLTVEYHDGTTAEQDGQITIDYELK